MAKDPAREGIRKNLETTLKPSPNSSLGRTVMRFLLIGVLPIATMLCVLYLQVYPIILLYRHGHVVLEGIRYVSSDRLGFVTINTIDDTTLTVMTVVTFLMVLLVTSHLLREQKEFPPGPPKKVCVMGSGIGGILTAKECLAQGHSVVVLEKTTVPGGVWRNRAWAKTMLTSSNTNTSLSDFVFQEAFLENDHVGFATRDQFVQYLDAYTEHFGVDKSIQFGCEVTHVVKKGEGYIVKWNKKNDKGAVTTESAAFDAIAVCTGLPNVPRPSGIEGLDKFEGEVVHSLSYKNAEPFKNQRVLVVGTGESASDIVAEVSDVSSEPVAISQHSPTLLLPRDAFEVPPDYFETRLLHLCPSAMRFVYLKTTYLVQVFFGPLASQLHELPKWFGYCNTLVGYKLPIDLNQPTSVCSIIHITKSGLMGLPISQGKAVNRPKAVRCCGGKTVEFEDGTQGEFDHIILANGYAPPSYPFLKSIGLECSNERERYHLTFNPEHPNLAFIGYSRGQVGALTTMMEMQARWFALLVSGRRRLPSKDAMLRRICSARAKTRGKYTTRSSWVSANYLARHEVLCEPNLLPLLFTRPGTVWKILTRSFATWQFRLNGPDAQPELALEAFDSVQLNPNVPLLKIHRLVMMASAFVAGSWSFIVSNLPVPDPLVVAFGGILLPLFHEVY